jgi:hypothetical protein
MRRILLDESVPLGLKAVLRENYVRAAPELSTPPSRRALRFSLQQTEISELSNA